MTFTIIRVFPLSCILRQFGRHIVISLKGRNMVYDHCKRIGHVAMTPFTVTIILKPILQQSTATHLRIVICRCHWPALQMGYRRRYIQGNVTRLTAPKMIAEQHAPSCLETSVISNIDLNFSAWKSNRDNQNGSHQGTGHISWCMLLTNLAVKIAFNDRFNVISDLPSAKLQLI